MSRTFSLTADAVTPSQVAASVLVATTLAFTSVAQAETIYVAEEGSDEAAGTAAAPLTTIAAALRRAEPGDVVHVAAGMFREPIVVARSGRAGSPITIEGERVGGKPATHIRTGTPFAGWEPAPRSGGLADECPAGSCGVYRRAVSFEPRAVTIDDGDVPRLVDGPSGHLRGKNVWYYLTLPPDARERTQYRDLDVAYWDGIEAMHFYQDGYVYLRMRDGGDPDDHHVELAPEGAVVSLVDVEHIVVRDLDIAGGQHGVQILGGGNHVVEGCSIRHGQSRFLLSNGTRDNHIRNNVMVMGGMGRYRPGAWAGDAEGYLYAVREHIYNVYKHEIGVGTYSGDEDRGFFIDGAGPGNVIEGNDIGETLIGVSVRNVRDVTVIGNHVHHTSSSGIGWEKGATEIRIDSNRIESCAHGIRFQELFHGSRSIEVVGNTIWSEEGAGNLTYWHTQYAPDGEPVEVLFAHNTLHGGQRGLSFNDYIPELGLFQVYMVNNIVSQRGEVWRGDGAVELGGFEHNWVGGVIGGVDHFDLITGTNMRRDGERLWAPGDTEPFVLPEGHEARNTGLDLSQPFRLGDRSFEPVLEPGYFTGAAPHRGATQDCEMPTACAVGGCPGVRACMDGVLQRCVVSEACEPPPALLHPVVYATPTLDGDLSEWTGPALRIEPGTASGSDNSLTVWIAWDEQALYVAYAMRDASLSALSENTEGPFYTDDALDLWLDPDASGTAMDPNDAHIIATLAGVQYFEGAVFEGAVSLDGVLDDDQADGGWSMEIAVPWELLGVNARAGVRIGADFAAADRDEGRDGYTYFDWAGLRTFDDPSSWGRIVLLAKDVSPDDTGFTTQAEDSVAPDAGPAHGDAFVRPPSAVADEREIIGRCSCRAAGAAPPSGWAAMVSLLAVAWRLRRRRQRG